MLPITYLVDKLQGAIQIVAAEVQHRLQRYTRLCENGAVRPIKGTGGGSRIRRRNKTGDATKPPLRFLEEQGQRIWVTRPVSTEKEFIILLVW